LNKLSTLGLWSEDKWSNLIVKGGTLYLRLNTFAGTYSLRDAHKYCMVTYLNKKIGIGVLYTGVIPQVFFGMMLF
jgi:hypothetical protein